MENISEYRRKKDNWLKIVSEAYSKPPMKVTTTVKKPDGLWGISRWIPFEEYLKMPNYRSDYYVIRCNEIIIEQDAPWDHPEYGVKVLSKRIWDALKKNNIPFTCYASGGKGIHFHIYWRLPDNEELKKKLHRNKILPRHIRLFLFKLINEEAKILPEYIGVGKPQDVSCLSFYDDGTGHLVRCPYGFKIDKAGNFLGIKTMISSIPDEKPIVKDLALVMCPTSIEYWTIPEAYLESFIASFKKPGPRKFKTSDYMGEHLRTPCAEYLLISGAPIGSRSLGAQILAIKTVLDNVSYDNAIAIGEQYYENIDNKDDFDLKEVINWFRWVYSKPRSEIYWPENCKLAKMLGICDEENCKFIKQKKIVDKSRKERKGGGRKNPVHLSKYWRSPKVVWISKKRKRRIASMLTEGEI